MFFFYSKIMNYQKNLFKKCRSMSKIFQNVFKICPLVQVGRTLIQQERTLIHKVTDLKKDFSV